MNIPVINHCQKTYRPNPEQLLTQILANIPEKFLVGLDEVRIFDIRPQKSLRKNIMCQPISAHHSVIELYMDDSSLSGWPFWSRVLLNTIFLGAVTEHILHDIQPNSSDQDILAYKPGRFNWRWGEYGIWRPVVSLLNALGHVIQRVPALRTGWSAMAAHVIQQAKISEEKRRKEKT